MPTVYNCKTDGDQYRITKFDDDLEVESSYLLTMAECECPAGNRPSCRHRQMLPKFMQRHAIDTEWFLDFDRGGWVQHTLASQPVEERASQIEPDREDAVTHPSPPADSGITIVTLGDPETLFNTIADAVGEPRNPTGPIQNYINKLKEIQRRRTTP